jgi:hypothetical protein
MVPEILPIKKQEIYIQSRFNSPDSWLFSHIFLFCLYFLLGYSRKKRSISVTDRP